MLIMVGMHLVQVQTVHSCMQACADLPWHAVEASSQRYLPPAARAAASAQVAAGQMSQLQRRVRGLLNRMSDSNLPGIVADVLQLAEREGERAVAEAITAELLQVCVCLTLLCGASMCCSDVQP